MKWESRIGTCALPCVEQKVGETCRMTRRDQLHAPSCPRGGGRAGREVQEAEGICIPVAEALFRMVKKNISEASKGFIGVEVLVRKYKAATFNWRSEISRTLDRVSQILRSVSFFPLSPNTHLNTTHCTST